MIFDKLENLHKYKSINKHLPELINFLETTNLSELPLGKVEINGDNLFALNIDALSFDDENAMYEYHKQYADLHIQLEPKEHYFFDFKENLKNVISEFDSEKDVAFYKKDSIRNLVRPKVGEFVFFFPGEAHLPKFTHEQKNIRKLIFKLKVEN